MELYTEQSRHIAYIVEKAMASGIRTLDASQEAEAAWVGMIQGFADANQEFGQNCTPGYYNNEGRPGEGPGWFGGNFGGTSQQFFELLRDWRAQGDLEGFEVQE